MNDATEIYVLDKRVRLLQPSGGFRTSLDSVMLAAACRAKAGNHILDMGCGVGGAGFCVLTRIVGTTLTGVDIQGDHIDLARRNIDLNDMAGRTEFIAGNITEFAKGGRVFDHVICNPPYMEAGTHTISPLEKKAIAHGHHDDLSIDGWLDAGFRLLKSGGSLTIVHRADMIDKIILGLKNRFGAVEIIPLWPRAGVDAKRVIVRAIKDRKSPAVLRAGIVLHEADGGYTEVADGILRGMQAIEGDA